MDINKVIFRVVKILFSITMFLVITYGIMSVGLVAFDFGYRVFTESAIDEEPGIMVKVTIEENMGSFEIGKLLYEKGLVRDANLFVLQHKLSAYADSILPGTYILDTAMTPKELMIQMSDETSQAVEETEAAGTTEISESSQLQ